MRKYFMLVLFIWCIISLTSCVKKKDVEELKHSEELATNATNNEVVNQQEDAYESMENIQKNYVYLQNQEITELGYLVNAEWNEIGDGFKIYCLNDISEYDNGPIYEFKFEDELFKNLREDQESSEIVNSFIRSINDRDSKPDPLIKLKVKDLVITVIFHSGDEITFYGYNDEFLKSVK